MSVSRCKPCVSADVHFSHDCKSRESPLLSQILLSVFTQRSLIQPNSLAYLLITLNQLRVMHSTLKTTSKRLQRRLNRIESRRFYGLNSLLQYVFRATLRCQTQHVNLFRDHGSYVESCYFLRLGARTRVHMHDLWYRLSRHIFELASEN